MSEAPKKSFQIKVLPKKGAAGPAEPSVKKRTSSPAPKKRPKKDPSQAFFFVLVGLITLIAVWLFLPTSSKVHPSRQAASSPSERKLNQYLQDGQKKTELTEMNVSVENQNAHVEDLPAFLPLDEVSSERRPMGVELSQDPALDKVYQDLYGQPGTNGEKSPEERISARLAERKWVHQFEREEKKTFIRNFIAAARDAGYEVELNEDLIVTKVRPLTSKPKVSLEKVIDKLNIN